MTKIHTRNDVPLFILEITIFFLFLLPLTYFFCTSLSDMHGNLNKYLKVDDTIAAIKEAYPDNTALFSIMDDAENALDLGKDRKAIQLVENATFFYSEIGDLDEYKAFQIRELEHTYHRNRVSILIVMETAIIGLLCCGISCIFERKRKNETIK